MIRGVKSGRSMDRIHLFVSGTVQGVGFRYATYREARRLGLVGWVRNTPDGRVEVLAEGKGDAIAQLEYWCRQGPPSAHVTSLQVVLRETREKPEFGAFDIDR